jgi:hypothetical protein
MVVPKKQQMLPILIVLFLVSYGLMTLLVVEQGRTIDNQRGLIRDLFTDSSQLNSIKSSALQKQNSVGQPKAPSSQVQPGDNSKTGHAAGKLRKQLPRRPPTAASDMSDSRRMVVTI